MKIILTAETSLAAVLLKNNIISEVKGKEPSVNIDTWSYVRSGDGFDVIYHNLSQYVEAPEKNVIFRVEVEGTEVTFSTAWWKSKPEPSKDMFCLHTGRLAEMVLRYFSDNFISLNIVDF